MGACIENSCIERIAKRDLPRVIDHVCYIEQQGSGGEERARRDREGGKQRTDR